MSPNKLRNNLRSATRSGRNAPRVISKIPQVSKSIVEDYELTPTRTQEILDAVSGRFKPSNSVLTEITGVSKLALESMLNVTKVNYSLLSDEDVFSIYFQKFSEVSFGKYINILMSEVKALQNSGATKSLVISHLESGITEFAKQQIEIVREDKTSQYKKADGMNLIDEFKKRLIEQLRTNLESI